MRGGVYGIRYSVGVDIEYSSTNGSIRRCPSTIPKRSHLLEVWGLDALLQAANEDSALVPIWVRRRLLDEELSSKDLVSRETQRMLNVSGLAKANEADTLALVPDDDDRGTEDLACEALKIVVQAVRADLRCRK